MRSQPAIVGTTLFLPVADAQRAFAIDISGPPCVQWVYSHETPLRTGAAFGQLPNGRKVIVFSDVASKVHMLDAATGQLVWIQSVGLYPLSLTTGTPAIHGDRIYVPISQYEISLGGNDDHECCRTHGAVTALDAMTGKKIWTTHTMEEAKPMRDRGDGKMIYGPSGAPIWNSPAIDAKRGVLYVGTGEATSEPAAPTTDAILAIDLKDGRIRWSFQATENDIFLTGCARNRNGLNCPKSSVHRDVDFGASVIIAQRSDGSDVVLAGQKSGTVWALDPDRDGKLVWRQDFGEGSPLGGIHWGIAYDGTRVFAPINRPYASAAKAEGSQKPGLNAVRVDTGAVEWTYTATPDCTGKRAELVKACETNIGFSGAPTVIDGAVISGSLDGFLHAFDAKTGELLYQVRHRAQLRYIQRRDRERRRDRQRDHRRRQRHVVRELGLWIVRADARQRAARVQAEGQAGDDRRPEVTPTEKALIQNQKLLRRELEIGFPVLARGVIGAVGHILHRRECHALEQAHLGERVSFHVHDVAFHGDFAHDERVAAAALAAGQLRKLARKLQPRGNFFERRDPERHTETGHIHVALDEVVTFQDRARRDAAGCRRCRS